VSDEGLDRELRAAQAARERQGLARSLQLDGAAPGVDFGSNDYLGLSRDPAVVAAMAAATVCGAGGRSARLLGGGSDLHVQCEAAVATWLGCDAALLFPSGYQANVGLIGALVGRGDAVISDRDNHASLIDGARLSRARVLVHEHVDLEDLERALRAAAGARRRLVVTEGVFSMGGDRAPLREIDALCRRHDAWLVVDEAHAAGLLGEQGAGAWAAAGVAGAHRVCARIVTGGKSLGVAGAFVAGSAALRAQLVHAARSFLFTTAPPPAVAGALVAAIERCRSADDLREAALARARRLAAQLAQPEPGAAIVPVLVGAAPAALELARTAARAGFYAPCVRPPTVAPERAGLRLVCHADHTDAQVDALAAALRAALPAAFSKPSSSRGQASRPTKVVCVAGTDTGVGKTVISALLLRDAQRRGCGTYWKPVQTGDDDDTATVAALSGAPPRALLPNHASFALPASPHEAAAAEGARVDVAALMQACERHRVEADGELILELAGGLLVPLDLDPPFLQLDWLARLRPDVVLVCRSGLGTLNHTLLSVDALRARGLTPSALFLVGAPHPSNFATLRRLTGIERCFEVPWLEAVDEDALDAWLDQNNLEVRADG
jgi:8-amino-7-oxononanoate synthase